MAEMTQSPNDTAIGIGIACGILGAWALTTTALVLAPQGALPSWSLPAVVAGQTFLYTGLFITAHDGMHGTICPRFPRINNALGAISVGVYALFDFRALRKAHHRHHRAPASPDDPDYHDGQHPHPVRWYLHFLKNYLSIWQIVGMAIIFNVLRYGLGLSTANMVLFWIVPSLLSTLQLFIVGTWLPHRQPQGGHRDQHQATSLALPAMLSLLACYHFGYHHEHHDRPAVPWWRLPQARRDALAQTG